MRMPGALEEEHSWLASRRKSVDMLQMSALRIIAEAQTRQQGAVQEVLLDDSHCEEVVSGLTRKDLDQMAIKYFQIKYGVWN